MRSLYAKLAFGLAACVASPLAVATAAFAMDEPPTPAWRWLQELISAFWFYKIQGLL